MTGALPLFPAEWPFGNLLPGHYGVILADPPWKFTNYSAKGEGKGPSSKYACMTRDQIQHLPVSQLAARDSVLFMWATWPMLLDALELMRVWGFTYKSGAPWAKQSSTGKGWAFGTGYIFRSASELLLVGTKGKPPVLSRSVRNLIVAPVREHSRKPEDAHLIAQQLYAGPYCELFAREARPGWHCWGNELGLVSFDKAQKKRRERKPPAPADDSDVSAAEAG